MEPWGFHPAVAGWFAERFGTPTPPQREGWPAIRSGRHALIAAPTGSGKTLAAFLWTLDGLVRDAGEGGPPRAVRAVYVSPLKALGRDVQLNLERPLAEIAARPDAPAGAARIRVAVRSGDTPAKDRAAMLRVPPHVLITTPESLYLLLTSPRSRAMLREARTVIVDEMHAVASDKRGAHLALSLERLDRACGRRLQRVGLSATQRPIGEMARLLVGAAGVAADGTPDCAIVDLGHRRDLDLSIWTPDRELGPVATHEQWDETYDRIAEIARGHRATLVFVPTRRMSERVAHRLTARLGEGRVAPHHGSLSREARLAAETGLKEGRIPVVVATASLELGIDVGHVDVVCHLGAPRSIAALLQRVGRAGHGPGAVPRGILFPMTRDELVQCAAAIRAVREGGLDRLRVTRGGRDVLAQHLVAEAAAEEIGISELRDLVRAAWPYRELPDADFDAVLAMLAEGVSDRRGRRTAWLHLDRVHGRVRARRGARLAALTNGGAIPDLGDYDVVQEPQNVRVGAVNEDFAIESQRGDVFTLGNRSWRIRRVERGTVRVEDAQGAPPTVPFWLGEAPGRTPELSEAVSRLRRDAAARLDADPAAAPAWLAAETGLDLAAAGRLLAYLAEGRAALGCVPTAEEIVAERCFDEAGGMQLILHAPFGSRINRAWGLALRKRFCLTFDFELQAAATDDGIVLSLGEQHSFPLESVFRFVRPATLREDLVQALLATPFFGNRWRWNATRALQVLRVRGGTKVPIAIQRMRAEDLLAAVFPEQLGCQDNRGPGPLKIPNHPLVNETVEDCLTEAVDLEGLLAILERLERGEIRTRAVESPAPSVFSHEILNANPYAFLDDAPLEERRARAVSLRRTAPALATELGRLDPAAIEAVRRQARPDVRDADELHDALLGLGWLPDAELEPGWRPLLDALIAGGRAARARWTAADGSTFTAVVAAERIPLLVAAVPAARLEPPLPIPAGAPVPKNGAEALRTALRGWMDVAGPATIAGMAARLGVPEGETAAAMAALEHEGSVLRGAFSEDGQFCDRRLLARIHRATLGALRREIEAVSPADFVRFLHRWQHAGDGRKLHGRDGVRAVLLKLTGFELPAAAWERDVLPLRVEPYDPADLDALCLSGEFAWGRLSGRPADAGTIRAAPPRRTTPIAFVPRDELADYLDPDPGSRVRLSEAAAAVLRALEDGGAAFTADLVRRTGRLRSEVEDALWELVGAGLVAGDGLAGLRALLTLSDPRWRRKWTRRHRGHAIARDLPAGRWAVLRAAAPERSPDDRLERFARQYLRRWGVVFRDLLTREPRRPPWWQLLSVYRRLEARGEIRGGRFVEGFVGEQYALPEAVEALRAIRRDGAPEPPLLLASADPLNLAGVLTPGPRIPPASGLLTLWRRGVPEASGTLGELRSRLQAAS